MLIQKREFYKDLMGLGLEQKLRNNWDYVHPSDRNIYLSYLNSEFD